MLVFLFHTHIHIELHWQTDFTSVGFPELQEETYSRRIVSEHVLLFSPNFMVCHGHLLVGRTIGEWWVQIPPRLGFLRNCPYFIYFFSAGNWFLCCWQQRLPWRNNRWRMICNVFSSNGWCVTGSESFFSVCLLLGNFYSGISTEVFPILSLNAIA